MHLFITRFLYFTTNYFYKVKTKLKRKWLIILPDYTNVTKSFKMTLISKHGPENMKSENKNSEARTKRWKLSFTKRMRRKCRLI